jgi:carbonic anhydrase
MQEPLTPAQAWRALLDGNERFVAGRREHPHQDIDRRTQLAEGQAPFAVVFGCSDSRVAAEIIFDRGLGDLFVVRTAGHVVDTGVLGSIEFGIDMLRTPLVVVLGHDSCGAVAATIKATRTGKMPGGYVRDIVVQVAPSLVEALPQLRGSATGELPLGQIIDAHTRHTVDFLVERSTAIRERVAAGGLAVVGVSYQLLEGRARLVSAVGDIGETVALGDRAPARPEGRPEVPAP